MLQEQLVWSDLASLGSSPELVRGKFAEIFGANPDGIALNDTIYFAGVNPPITQQYNHFCYKTIGEINWGPSQKSSKEAAVGSHTVYNHGNTAASMTFAVTASWTESQGWSATETLGVKISGKLSVKDVFEIGGEVNLSVAIGQSGSTSQTRTSQTSVTVTVPPMSQVKVDMIAIMTTETITFTAPLTVTGMLGANFPDRVNGHYFWFSDVAALVPKTTGSVNGEINETKAFNVQAHIGAATPITS